MVHDDISDASDAATEWLTEMLYTGVGLGILAVNRFQVARRSAESALQDSTFDLGANPGIAALSDVLSDPERLDAVLGRFKDEISLLDDRLGGLEEHLSAAMARIEPDLPEAARELTRAAKRLLNEHGSDIRAVLGLKANP